MNTKSHLIILYIEDRRQVDGSSFCQTMEFYEVATFVKNGFCMVKDFNVLINLSFKISKSVSKLD